MKSKLFLVVLIFGLFGCSVISTKPPKTQDVRLIDLEILRVGKVKSSAIPSKFGEPSMRMASDREGAVSWLYSTSDNPQKQRVGFVFDAKSNVLKEINWMVYENEEQDGFVDFIKSKTNDWKVVVDHRKALQSAL